MPFFVYISSALLLFFSFSASSEVEFDYEIDPYYSNTSLFFPLNNESISTVELKNEREIYFTLFKDAFTPKFFAIELSINPLPILGVYLKKHQTELYETAEITEDLNLIAAFTEGFEEPYALTFFLGNVIKFTLPNEKNTKSINKGFSGFVLSIGDQHIRDNSLFDDQWMEVEWKLKGDRRLEEIYHSFSFRVGAKSHQHDNIESSYYFGLRRELFNSTIKEYGILDNIGVDFRMDYSRTTKKLIQSQLFIDKRWPTTNGNISFGFGLKRVKNKYLNDLDYLNHDVQLILRPSITF